MDVVVSVSIILAAVAACVAVWEYRLKVEGEKRLQKRVRPLKSTHGC